MRRVIDVSCFLGTWPFRRIPRSTRADLNRLAESCRLHRVVVSRFENLFWENAMEAAGEFADAIDGDDLLIHFPIINPTFPAALDDLRRLHERRAFRGVRLLSNYHGYSLTDPAVESMLDWTVRTGLVVQIFRRIVDERLQWMMKVPPVADDQLKAIVLGHPDQRFMLSAMWFGEILSLFEAMGRPANVWFDVSRCRGPEEWPLQLIEAVPPRQIVFGSLWPLQVIRSTLEELLLAPIDDDRRTMILSGNAAALIQA